MCRVCAEYVQGLSPTHKTQHIEEKHRKVWLFQKKFVTLHRSFHFISVIMTRITTKEEALARVRHSIQIKKEWLEASNLRLNAARLNQPVSL